MAKIVEHAPELKMDSPAYDIVIRELDKLVYDDPSDVAEGITLRDASISTESLLGDLVHPFKKTKEDRNEARSEAVRKLSEALHLKLTLGTPIWKIVKDYESLMKVQ